MKWAAASSDVESFSLAVDRLLDDIHRQLDDAEPDLVLTFATRHHADSFHDLARLLASCFGKAAIIGCSGGGVIGGGRELEQQKGIAVVAASLKDVGVVPFHVDSEDLRDLATAPETWHEWLDLVPEQQPVFVLLHEPFGLDAETLLHSLDSAFPGCPMLGGLAAGGEHPGDHALVLDDTILRAGAVGVALYGDVALDTVVAQGCRPVGPKLTVGRTDRNLLFELDGRSAVEVLDQVFSGLPPRDQELFRRSPLVGLGTTPGEKTDPGGLRSDWLVRNLIGADRSTGVIGVSGVPRQEQSLRFHVRDAHTASEEVDTLLRRHARQHTDASPVGALLFSCVGRGAAFYGVPDHDSRAFAARMGPVPLGGFFCNGEIAPVHGRSALHAYTSAFGIFRPRGWS